MPDRPENSAFKLLSSRKTLVMATVDKSGAPNVSYAPFVHHAPPLYVYTSSRSRHTRNMMETAKGERDVHRRRSADEKLFRTKALYLPLQR